MHAYEYRGTRTFACASLIAYTCTSTGTDTYLLLAHVHTPEEALHALSRGTHACIKSCAGVRTPGRYGVCLSMREGRPSTTAAFGARVAVGEGCAGVALQAHHEAGLA